MENSGGNMCRCCASEGVYKDLNTTYHWMGEEEVYGDMLKDCFNVQLSVPESSDGGICEVCITQLRNAINFKKQVLLTEEQFKKHVQKVFKTSIVKVEALADDDSTDANVTDDGLSEPEFDEVPIKTEHVAETVTVGDEIKPKKRAAPIKASTSRTKKSKSSDAESPKKHPVTRSGRQRSSGDGAPTKLSLDKKLNFCSFITIRPVGKRVLPSVRERQQRISYQKRLTELDWHFDNIKTILECSNATPMRCRVGARYACSYCLDQFADPASLRRHTTKTHAGDSPDFFKLRSLSKHVVYLDITDLMCTICNVNIDGLQDLTDHLKSTHDALIHKQIKNQIVPYKYNNGKLLCTMCPTDLEQFADIQDHMREHFKNYVCDFCNSGFVIRSKLLEHKKTVHLV